MPDVDYHGWTHRPKAQGGTDPVEVDVSGEVAFPVVHSVQGDELEGYYDGPNSDGFSTFSSDLTAPFGSYLSSIGCADGEGIYFGLGPLGPRTGWGLDVWLRRGSDSGRCLIEFGTTPTDEDTAYAVGTDQSISDPEGMVDLGAGFSGWFNSGDLGGVGDRIDLYHASATDWSPYKLRGRIWVAGADGTMLTSDGTNPGGNPFFNANEMDAGGDASVNWWVKFRSDDKNASSSGYGFRLAGFRMFRYNGNGARVS